ncbi:hypothetical protein M885DRAFT_535276 [Pelagophyceae sp. CCMP2097]|nr:hypothetical protein M885DRAFT_535276 [Pelagophyceae sp. CCMP2097]
MSTKKGAGKAVPKAKAEDRKPKAADRSEDAAVGSISHILRTLFRGLYDEAAAVKEQARQEADDAAQVKRVAKADAKAQRAAEAERAEAEHAAAGDEPEAAAAAVLAQSPSDVLSVGGDSTVESTVASFAAESLADAPAETDASRHWFRRTLSELKDSSATTAAAQSRGAEISARLKRQQAQAYDLSGYLQTELAAAAAADHAAERALKQRGLLISAHIPMAASTMHLEKDALQRGGAFALSLVTAGALVAANRGALASRSGNARGGRAGTPQLEAAAEPGYLKTTAATTVRRKIVLKRSHGPMGVQHTTDLLPLPPRGAAEARPETGTFAGDASLGEAIGFTTTQQPSATQQPVPPVKRPPARPSVEQHDMDMKVLQRMDQKLHFLRNPRFDASNPNNARRLVLKPPTPPTLDARDGGATPSRTTASRTAAPLQDAILFADPAVVHFDAYVVGGVYELAVHIRNASTVCRRLRYSNPVSKYFSISHVKWPGARDTSGNLAPGMALRLLLRFAPDSLAEYDDEIVVATEAGDVRVPLVARRRAAVLSLPAVLDVGACHVGGRNCSNFRIVNSGGAGRFRLVDPRNHPEPRDPEHGDPEHGAAQLQVGPFVVSPTAFDLLPGAAVDVSIFFSPADGDAPWRAHDAEFLLVGDDARVVSHRIIGKSEALGVSLAAPSTAVEGAAAEHVVFFESKELGTASNSALTVANGGALPLRYEWYVSGDSRDGFKVGPASGMLGAAAETAIDVSYAPRGRGADSAEAVLVVCGVPALAAQSSGLAVYRDHAAAPFAVVEVAPDGAAPVALVDVVAARVVLRGAGHLCRLDADPVALVVADKLIVGVDYELREAPLKLTNPSAVAVEWRWGAPIFVSGPVSALEVSLEPRRGVLAPFSTVASVATLCAELVGRCEVAVPVVVRAPGGEWYESTRIVVRTTQTGGRLRFVDAEVDLGLVAVGATKEYSLAFTNPTKAPLAFSFGELEGDEPRQRGRSMGSLDGSSVEGGAEEFAIRAKICRLFFQPRCGVLAAGETSDVRVVCTAGKLPQRLRAVAACRVRGASGAESFDVEDDACSVQHVAIRGEVQTPHVYLEQCDVAVGTVYVGVAVQRTVRLVNLSNLSTRYRFERPQPSAAFDVEFSDEAGELAAKEARNVGVTLRANVPGVLDEVVGCQVFGMAEPLGFVLSAVAKAAVVTYEILEAGAEAPGPLAPADAPQLPESVIVPAAPPLPRLDFGAVPLFDRKTLRLLVRNMSAITANFRFEARKFRAANLAHESVASTKTKQSTRRGRDAPAARPKMLLDSSNEAANTFTSAAGLAHVAKRRQAAEDAEVLSRGLGCAFDVDVPRGTLPPWGSMVVEVTAFNNMAGSFRDDLDCVVDGAPPQKLALRLAVAGCPLSLRPECAGLDLVSDVSRPLLRFGAMLRGDGATAVSRRVRVRNAGPVDAMLTWRFAPDDGSGGDDGNLVRLTVGLTSDKSKKNCELSIKWREKVAYVPPYVIEPAELRVSAHSDAAFTLTLPAAAVANGSPFLESAAATGELRAELVADAKWLPDARHVSDEASADGALSPVSQADRSLADRSQASGGSKSSAGLLDDGVSSALRLRLRAGVAAPQLQLEKLGADGSALIRFKVPSTSVAPATRRAMLRNCSDVAIDLNLSTDGPFSVVRATSATFKVGGDALRAGAIVTLPPKHVVTVEVAFSPPQAAKAKARAVPKAARASVADLAARSADFATREALALSQTTPLAEPPSLKKVFSGELVISYATGQAQRVSLEGVVLRPALAVSPPCHDFGLARASSETPPMRLTVFLSNPTAVEAAWRVVHVPADAPEAGVVDDASAFEWTDRAGALPGPSLPLSSAAACLPKDFNRLPTALFGQTVTALTWKGADATLTLDDALRGANAAQTRAPFPLAVSFRPKLNRRYTSRFRFLVQAGEPFDVILSGHGTFEEDVPEPAQRVAARLP